MRAKLILPLLLVASVAAAADAGPSDGQKAICQKEGGCIMVTRAALEAALMQAYKAGTRNGFIHCKGDA